MIFLGAVRIWDFIRPGDPSLHDALTGAGHLIFMIFLGVLFLGSLERRGLFSCGCRALFLGITYAIGHIISPDESRSANACRTRWW